MTPRRTVTVFSVAIYALPRQPFFKMLESCEFYMVGCIIKQGIQWSLPEVHKTLFEEVIKHFLKVCDSLSLHLVTGCAHGEFWQQTFAIG